jgi:penicillin-binding protein 1A
MYQGISTYEPLDSLDEDSLGTEQEQNIEEIEDSIGI